MWFVVSINADSKLEKSVQLCNSKTEDITIGDTSEEDQYELLESEDENEGSECIESGEIERSLDSEEENFFKVYRSKKRMRILSSSDSEDRRTSIPSTSQNVMGEIEIAVDGTRWIKQSE
ncbi:hypothetical protein K0M31_016078 [Melipona bicolor]|uniref:Uncharacterized protein n=1 Tax=Melipona bicolor TaxID=60889 RepID=A0AA40KTD4_9HYME|nr:hypothetical protein K0M31_016078 [Melipona bicolor]